MRPEQADICNAFMRIKRLDIGQVMSGLSVSEYGLMKVISLCGRENGKDCAEISQIARKMEVSVPAVSRYIRKLESEGLAERTVNRSDRRFTFVSVTEKGKELIAENDTILSDLMDRILDRIGTENADRLIDNLNAFCSASAAEIDKIKKEEKN